MSAVLRPSFFFATLACALFATSPVFAAPTSADEVIVPKAAAASKSEADTRASTGSGTLTFVAVIALGAAGAWMLWRNRKDGGLLPGFGRGAVRAPKNLAIEETRSLGNRQYLVVASYQDKKFLLGVCQGRIDLLSSLNDASSAPEKPRP